MKALSVNGNYVMDMIAGKKKIEYRTWPTKYRGPVLICSTVRKIAGAAPGYALCIANLYDVDYSDLDRLYYWHIKNVKPIKPIHVKGQLRLFNVSDKLIKPISKAQFYKEVEPLIYKPRKRKKKR